MDPFMDQFMDHFFDPFLRNVRNVSFEKKCENARIGQREKCKSAKCIIFHENDTTNDTTHDTTRHTTTEMQKTR